MKNQISDSQLKWDPSMMVKIRLNKPDDFLKVKETLSRIGVASRKEKKLYQSTHILHKQGEYYITHFKELFALDGKPTDISLNDIQRRNRIISLLESWGLIDVVDREKISDLAPMNQIKVIAFTEKNDWVLEPKYNIGKKVKK